MSDIIALAGTHLYRADPDKFVRLPPIFSDDVRGLEAELGVQYARALAFLSNSIESLTTVRNQGLIVVLQGMHASGKDGVIQEFSTLPALARNTRMAHFRVPDVNEARHDFLWRVHIAVPARGEIVFFNRSHYEDVIEPCVSGHGDSAFLKTRYGHIVAFERLLFDEGIRIVKLFLHVSQQEQLRRLKNRLTLQTERHSRDNFTRAEHWDEYIRAYEAAIKATTTEFAPWYIIPADNRQVRNILVAAAIVRELRTPRADFRLRRLE